MFSPTDFRYNVKELVPYLSEKAYVQYKARVEAALASELASVGICSKSVANEIRQACELVTAEQVYAEEARIKHDIRALVNVIRGEVSDEAKPYVHLTATSYDIVDTANSLRFKEAISKVVLPDLAKLEYHLIQISRKYASTVQIGRTHGQHAEPITFGFFVSNYVSRLGKRIVKLRDALFNLTGKFSGAVGVYGPLSLLLENPEAFEEDLLKSLDLASSEVSSQIVQPEPLTDLMHQIVVTFGVIANFCRDMRNLQRSEIGEISEDFGTAQVGSSTMPQKRNPISFENIESLWKKFMPQMITVYLDQISEHQRDLTNSASQRYLVELIVAFDYCVRRLDRTIWNEKSDSPRLVVNKENMRRNLESNLDNISAEPLYVLLAISGHPDAHEVVRKFVQESIENGMSFRETIKNNSELGKYLRKLGPEKRLYIERPESYIGLAEKKTLKIVGRWEESLSDIVPPK